jgi:hypothetical protein
VGLEWVAAGANIGYFGDRTLIMHRFLISLLALGLLAGCATAPSPPLTADDPANPSATEAPVQAIPNALDRDRLSRKTQQILAQASREQQANQGGPDAADQNNEKMKNMPDMPTPQPQPMPQAPPKASPTPDSQSR